MEAECAPVDRAVAGFPSSRIVLLLVLSLYLVLVLVLDLLLVLVLVYFSSMPSTLTLLF